MVKSLPVADAATAKPQKKPRSTAGAAEAKAAATMTKEQWDKHQVGMAQKWPQPEYMAIPMPGRSHTSYRDQTYELITRWTSETKISYRPHAKSPGSKSHIRYEKYAKAKTVGQALTLGSWPADWCWDYERGFIKVLGPIRDEPIDIAQVEGSDVTKKFTDVDNAIYRWYNRELAKNLGVNYKDLFGSGEPSIVRAHRLVAQREAKKALEAAEKEQRKITDEEITDVLKAWAFMKNANRQNVIPEGQDWVKSDTLGLLRDRVGSTHITKASKVYPEVLEVLVKWLHDRIPAGAANFKFTSLNLNCNYAAKRHRDGNNFGPSFIKAFGAFTGGELNYWPEDDRTKVTDVDTLPEDKKVQFAIGGSSEGGLALFNGNCAHSVEDFEGNRFSVVWFCIGSALKASKEDRALLENLGFKFPAEDEERHCILRAPRGYGRDRAAATPARAGSKSEKPEFVFVPNAKLADQKPKQRGEVRAVLKTHVLKRPAAAKA